MRPNFSDRIVQIETTVLNRTARELSTKRQRHIWIRGSIIIHEHPFHQQPGAPVPTIYICHVLSKIHMSHNIRLMYNVNVNVHLYSAKLLHFYALYKVFF